jgi:hypothetical protein
VGPRDRFLDFRRIDAVPGNMADIVQIPIEAFKAIQHSHCIIILRSAPMKVAPVEARGFLGIPSASLSSEA